MDNIPNMNNRSVAELLAALDVEFGALATQVEQNPPPVEDNTNINNSIISIMKKCETIKNNIPTTYTSSTNGGSRKQKKKSKKSKTHKRKH